MYGVFVHYTANTDIYTDLHSLSLHDALPTYGRQRFNGELVGIDGDVVLISDKEGVEHRLPFDAIDTAKLVLTDKLIAATDRKSVVSGKSVSVRVDLGGRRIIKKINHTIQMATRTNK